MHQIHAARHHQSGFFSVALSGLVLVAIQTLTAGEARRPEPPANVRWSELFRKLPFSFEANRGQAGRRVKFLARGRGSTLFLTHNEAVLQINEAEAGARAGQADSPGVPRLALRMRRSRYVRFTFPGSNPFPRVIGVDEQPGKSNYFAGRNAARWRTGVPHYARVEYRDLYPGVTLVYYGHERQLEYDFVVRPGSDPKLIRLAVRGVGPMKLDGRGNLTLGAGREEVRLRRPVAYQERDGQRQDIEARFALAGRHVSFEIGAYDATRPLIIDPVLAWSTYLGGGADEGSGVAVDAAGNIYVVGWTYSHAFPTVNALQANSSGVKTAFVTKLNPSGSALLYSTYLGGSRDDEARAVAVDAKGSAYVTGVTMSSDFPVQNALQPRSASNWTAFVTKLSPDGSALVYSTYLGGGSIDEGWGIAVDSAGNAYVTGQTLSKDFPAVNAVQPAHGGGPVCINFCDNDAFVSMLSADGRKLVYSTYLGGSDNDTGRAIAVDAAGNAVVTGESASPNFPASRPFQSALRGRIDAFVAKLSPGGKSLVYSTYLGGSKDDTGRGIAVDQAGNAYVTGATGSPDFPLAAPLQPAFGGGTNAFVSKLNADGSALLYSTYLGGSLPASYYLNTYTGSDSGAGIALDRDGNAYVTGSTASIDFPLVQPLDVARKKGVFRSTDRGVSWTGANAGLSGALSLGNSLQIDRQNPSTLYLGTQGGLFKSTDNGAHWNATGLKSPIYSLAVDPRTPSILYAGTDGFARSTDGGATWTPDPITGQALAVLVDPADPSVVYRAGAGTLLRSADRGATWSSIYTGLPTTVCGDSPSSCTSFSITLLAIAPASPSTIYAATRESSIGPLPHPMFPFLYKRVGSGWQAISSGLPSRELTAFAVDPFRSGRLYAGNSAGLFRSDDGGGTWMATKVTKPVLSMAFDPADSSIAYAGVQGGVLKSSDGGDTWTATALDKTSARALAIDSTTSSTIYAVADSGSDAFVAEINAAGDAIVYSTTLGGADSDLGKAVAVDTAGNVYVTGTTSSTDFPTVAAFQAEYHPNQIYPSSAFVARIAAGSSGNCPVSEPNLGIALPPGFYIAEVRNAPGTAAGYWGMEVLVAKGPLSGGFDLGGGLQENGATPAFGAFYLAEPQNVSVDLRAQVLSGASGGPFAVRVRLLDASRRQIGDELSGSGSIQFSTTLQQGFYIVEVRSGSTSPRANFQMGLNGASFSGGADTGGFVSAGQVGFGAFYIPESQDVSIHAFGQSYGSVGATCLQLTLRDSARNVIATQP